MRTGKGTVARDLGVTTTFWDGEAAGDMGEIEAQAPVEKDNGTVRVPKAKFIEDVDDYMKGKDFEQTMRELQTLFQQYKQIEQGLQQNRIRLGNKLPEIKRALDTVKLLKEKSASGDELDMDYELTDSVFAKAKVKDAQSVYLWLGANVMLEYSLDDAENLLQTNHENCARNLATNKSDLAFVKDNVTITEVSIARVYNWDVKRRKAAKEAENK